MNNYKYIFIEGFLLYEDESLAKMSNKKYFIEIDENTVRSRRARRVYVGLADPKTYFDCFTWPNYITYKTYCEATNKDIIYLDGNDSTNYLANFIKNDIFVN
jgi:uridine kinase